MVPQSVRAALPSSILLSPSLPTPCQHHLLRVTLPRENEFLTKDRHAGAVRGGVLGSLGLLFLLYTVVTTIQKVEESFNFVWRVEQPRSFGRRFSEYLSVMVVGPAVIVAALGFIATLASTIRPSQRACSSQPVVRAATVAPAATALNSAPVPVAPAW